MRCEEVVRKVLDQKQCLFDMIPSEDPDDQEEYDQLCIRLEGQISLLKWILGQDSEDPEICEVMQEEVS